jgi:predicted transcriptional regulator
LFKGSSKAADLVLLDSEEFIVHLEKKLPNVPALLPGHARSTDMTTAKERIVEIIQQQPDDSSYEEIIRELAFARMIERGLEDSRAGRTLSHEEMGRRIRTWQR